MIFEIDFSSQPRKFLKKSDKQLSLRIIGRINLLKTDPVPHNSVRVVGEEKTFRIRIGDYRALYEIDWNNKTILIAKIDKRSKVYE